MGRAIVMVPALCFVLSFTEMEPCRIAQLAVGPSLAMIFFTSLSSTWGRYQRGTVDAKLLKLCAPSILIGVVLGGVASGLINGRILITVSATMAALVAVGLVLRKTVIGAAERSFSRSAWAIFGLIAGAISAMVNGGGTARVPLLNFLGYDIRRTVGTASAIDFVIGILGVITYAVTGLGAYGLPPFSPGYVNLLAVLIIITLATGFARVGVRITDAVPKRALRLAFCLFLGLTSTRMFVDRANALT